MLGPFIITPVMLCAILLSASSIPWLNKRWWAIVGWASVTVMLPFVLEWAGWLAPSWTMSSNGIESFGSVFVPARMQPSIIILGHAIAVLLVALYARRIGQDRSDAQRRLFLQAWRLRHLLPKTQPSATPR
jgi:hypothetical protein